MFTHDHLAQPVQPWGNILARVQAKHVPRPAGEGWGFFYPPQTLLLSPTAEHRAARFLLSWMRILPAWQYLHQTTPGLSNALKTQWWRDILANYPKEFADPTTNNAARIQLIRSRFSHLFREEEFNARDGRVTWREHHLRNVPNGFVKCLVWELTELSFRQDLIALDRALVPQRNYPR